MMSQPTGPKKKTTDLLKPYNVAVRKLFMCALHFDVVPVGWVINCMRRHLQVAPGEIRLQDHWYELSANQVQQPSFCFHCCTTPRDMP